MREFRAIAMSQFGAIVLAFPVCVPICLVFMSRAQSAAPAAPPAASQAAAPPAASQSGAAPSLSLQVEAPLVTVDIVVTDSQGRPVHSLTQAEFSVFEDGHRMTPQSFEEHRADLAQPPAPPPVKRDLGVNVFSDIGPAPAADRPLTVLLLDALNTPWEDQAQVRRQMLDYASKLPPGTRMAIFGLSTRLFMLQGFSSDPAVLKAALDSKKNLPKSSQLLVTPEEADDQQTQNEANNERLTGSIGNDPLVGQIEAAVEQFQAEVATQQITLRVQMTLAAMDDLARYLSLLPGRKNLIWFSGSFPVNILPDPEQASPFAAVANFTDNVKATSDKLAKAQVAVYPVDARGLFGNPAFSASVGGSTMGGTPPRLAGGGPRLNNAARSQQNFFEQTTNEHFTMDQMAEETGGRAFYNTNGLEQAVQAAMDQGANYYTLTYVPENRKWDGGFRRIKVTTEQRGVQLAYRRGYYADNPRSSLFSPKALPFSYMQAAMMFGAPLPTDIRFDVAVDPAAATVAVAPGGNHFDSNTKPPYRQYTILYAADLHRVAFTPVAGGKYHASLEFVAVVYDGSGQRVNFADSTARDFSAGEYKSLMTRGMLFRQEVAAPAKGEYFLRVGVLDDSAERAGAVEIPLAAIHPRPVAAATK